MVILIEKPRVAARDMLIAIDDIITNDIDAFVIIDEYLGLLPILSLGWNLNNCDKMDVILASLMATRPHKNKLTNRDNTN